MEESSITALPVEDAVNLKELEEALEVEGAREIAAGFLEDVAAVPGQLTEALRSNDANATRSAAHLLKGCCLIIFARKTAELAAEMERMAIAKNLSDGQLLLPVLLESLHETVVCLQNYLDES